MKEEEGAARDAVWQAKLVYCKMGLMMIISSSNSLITRELQPTATQRVEHTTTLHKNHKKKCERGCSGIQLGHDIKSVAFLRSDVDK